MNAKAITKQDVEKVARLAYLQLGDEEVAALTSQLAELLDHVKQLETVDVTGIDPTFCVTARNENVLRDDCAAPSLSLKLSLVNAPESVSSRFRVPPLGKED